MFFCLVFSSLAFFSLNLLIYLFLRWVLLLRRLCSGSSSGATPSVHGLLIAVAFPCRAQGLGHAGFCSCAMLVQKLRSRGCRAHGLSCSAACGIFPGQGSNS